MIYYTMGVYLFSLFYILYRCSLLMRHVSILREVNIRLRQELRVIEHKKRKDIHALMVENEKLKEELRGKV